MTRKIIIDTDPGQDDALAILLALASQAELEVLGLVAVAGNVPLRLTQSNARALVELAGRDDVPVFAGCARPLLRPLVTAEYVHGKTGIDGSGLPAPSLPLQKQHGVDWLIDTVMAHPPGSITLCTLGPLTNVAMALTKHPAIAERIGEIVAMGGGFFEGGNTTPAAEFNIYVDPHAAHAVFAAGIKMTLMPLDVTHKALTTRERLARFGAIATPAGRACHGMLGFFDRFDSEKYGQQGAPLHDPTVIAYLLQPELFTGKHVNVEVETGSPLTVGMTVVDWWGTSKRAPNCTVMNGIDADGYFDLLIDRIATL
ncbi:MAG: nucleoside hydrolase [Alphaproteobacteria bacterium]